MRLRSLSEETLYVSFVAGSLLYADEVDETEPEEAPLTAPQQLELGANREMEADLVARCIVEMAPGPFSWRVPVVGDPRPVEAWRATLSAGYVRVSGSCP